MTDIHSILSPPQPTKRLIGHKARLQHLLQTYSERGLTLAAISDPKITNRSVATLKRYCRLFQIAFSDYTPNSMKVKRDE